jgi:hypothetical protein
MLTAKELLKTNPEEFFRNLSSSYDKTEDEKRVPKENWGYFAEPNTTGLPNPWFDKLMPALMSLKEYDVVAYVTYALRHTYGYGKKLGDFIREDQFINGTVTKEGRRVDWGAGIGSSKDSHDSRRARVRRAGKKAETMGLIEVKRGLKIKPSDKYSTNFIRPIIDQLSDHV